MLKSNWISTKYKLHVPHATTFPTPSFVVNPILHSLVLFLSILPDPPTNIANPCLYFLLILINKTLLISAQTHTALKLMADFDTKMPNGVLVVEDARERKEEAIQELTLYTIFSRLIDAVFFPDPESIAPLLQRIKSFLSDNIPMLPEASTNTGRRVLAWVRRGSPFRALLVASVGTIALLVLTGLLVFTLFFVAATVNAIVISLLVSLAAVGVFLALFFSCVAAIYIGALLIAICVISAATVSAIFAVLIAAGWIGFFWALWVAAKKSVSVAKRSFSMTGSAVSAYSSVWHTQHHNISKKLR